MTVRDRDRALHALSHISYYRLRAYWLSEEIPTTTSGDHAFRRGVDFDNILDLYCFDRKLRLLVMDAIDGRSLASHALGVRIRARYGGHSYEDPALFRNAGPSCSRRGRTAGSHPQCTGTPKNYVDTQVLDLSYQSRRMTFNRRAFQR